MKLGAHSTPVAVRAPGHPVTRGASQRVEPGSGELLGSLLVEALVLTIQPVPWATSNVWAYEALGLFTFFRIYLAGRFVRDLAQVQAQREVLHSMQEGRAAVPLSCRLAFKVLYAQFPAATLSTASPTTVAASPVRTSAKIAWKIWP